MSDLRNLKALAWFLQKFELNFDILSSLKELSRQIKGEFDFRWGVMRADRSFDYSFWQIRIVFVCTLERSGAGDLNSKLSVRDTT